MTTTNHVTAIVNAGKEAIASIDKDLIALDAQRKTLIAEKRKLAGLIKSYTKEEATSETEATTDAEAKTLEGTGAKKSFKNEAPATEAVQG